MIDGERPPHRARQCRTRRSAARSATCPNSRRCSAKAICCRLRSCRATEWQSLVLPTPMALSPDRAADGRAAFTTATATRCRDSVSAGCRATMRRCSTSTRSTARGTRRRLRPYRAGLRFLRTAARRDGWLHALFRYRHRARRPCRRDQFRRACLQHDADLSRRAAILYRPAAGTVDAAVPAPRRRRLRHAVPPDLPGVAAVAPARARPKSFSTTARARSRRAAPGDPLLRLAPVALSRAVRRRDPRPRRRPAPTSIVRDPTCRLFGYHGLLGRDGAFSLDHMFGF